VDDFVGKERTCSVCGKQFVIFPEWVYKRGGDGRENVFCSYGCMRKFDARHDRSKREKRDAIIQAIRDGLTTTEICALIDTDHSRVWYWRQKLKQEDKRDEGIKNGDQDL